VPDVQVILSHTLSVRSAMLLGLPPDVPYNIGDTLVVPEPTAVLMSAQGVIVTTPTAPIPYLILFAPDSTFGKDGDWALRLDTLQLYGPKGAGTWNPPIVVGSGGGGGGGTSPDALLRTIVDAKGDLMVASGADVVTRMGVGANGTVLTADTSATTGMRWLTPATGTGGGVTDHGALTGLGDDDHPQYILAAGDSMTGALNVLAPTTASNPATKAYVDAVVAADIAVDTTGGLTGPTIQTALDALDDQVRTLNALSFN
jgi:hypothetical protein